MVRPAIQLYTLRELDGTLTETLRRVADTAYEGVEFAGLAGNSAASVADTLSETGLEAVGAHVPLDALRDDYESVVDAYGELGCERIVVPTYGDAAFASETGVDEAAAELSALAARLTDDGFETHYHNHAYEFAERDGEFDTAYDAFAADTDGRLDLEFDVGLARHGGVDPTTYLDRYADRISLVHLTDTVPGDDESLHVELGEGVVDVDACARAAADADVSWLIHENGLTTDPATTLTESAARVRELVGAV
ncbi:sugar phosphate isomerase/epimerase family protein [Halogeometricum limi]|uniref:Sugar phosphate isomerase/epimerase n=1 Tax=Halogeometricum limi TaxID=555875 RepID=A0A1I6IBF8_9EURY|nr:sugar phosphate isomerase/epimerase [Halogeometricum limi]SFR64155.1 Sugar phosphate isomerase/epimerase [Halogeometricum limi]